MANLLNWLGGLPGQVFGITSVMSVIGVTTLVVILIIWSLVWKGLAMWKAARKGSKVWFIVFLLVNTVGLLEIIYYYYWSKRKR